MEDGRGRKDKDAFLATMYRLDPDRLRQLRRVVSGVTRCPECDAVNQAALKHCSRCGARLYPVEEADEGRRPKRAAGRRRDGDGEKR